MRSFYFTIILSLQLISISCIAQTSVNSASLESTVQEFTIQASLGEMCGINTKTIGNTNIISEGFIQPNYSFILSSKDIDLLYDIHIFPNPCSSLLNVSIHTPQTTSFSLSLLNIYGDVVYTFPDQIAPSGFTTTMSLDFYTLSSGVYILNIKQNHLVKSYKIVKI